MNAVLSQRSPGAWFPAVMMKQIMTFRVAAVALAASALIAAPAMADPVRGAVARLDTRLSPSTGLTIRIGHRVPVHAPARHHVNAWGQTPVQARQLRRNAVQACRAAIGRTARRVGFRDVDFDDDRRVRQTGPNAFRIRFDDVEFETRRHDRERDVTCTVQHGHVTRIDGLPQAGRVTSYSRTGHFRHGR